MQGRSASWLGGVSLSFVGALTELEMTETDKQTTYIHHFLSLPCFR